MRTCQQLAEPAERHEGGSLCFPAAAGRITAHAGRSEIASKSGGPARVAKERIQANVQPQFLVHLAQRGGFEALARNNPSFWKDPGAAKTVGRACEPHPAIRPENQRTSAGCSCWGQSNRGVPPVKAAEEVLQASACVAGFKGANGTPFSMVGIWQPGVATAMLDESIRAVRGLGLAGLLDAHPSPSIVARGMPHHVQRCRASKSSQTSP